MQVGDLVRMKTHDTGLIGVVVEMNPRGAGLNVAIRWNKGSGKINWEPYGWLEVVSESR